MKLKVSIAISLVVMTLFACGACVQTQKPAALTNQGEVVIGVLDDMSGPNASMGTAYMEAQNDAIKYINEEKGGILGHKLTAIIVDHKMDSTLAISGWDRMKNQGAPVILSVAAMAVGFIGKSCNTDRITVITGAGTMEQTYPTEPSYYFITTPQMYGIVDAACDMIQKDWNRRGKTGVPKVGFDVVSFGSYQKMYTKMSKMAAEKRGFEYVFTYTSIAPADVSTQVLQVKNFGCDYLYLLGSQNVNILWLKELDRQNFHPVIFGYTALAVEEIPQATGNLCLGTTYCSFGPQWSDIDNPLIKTLRGLNTNWYPEVVRRPGAYCRAFNNFIAVTEGLKRAVQNVGYENLNGTAMKEAMESIRDFDPMESGVEFTWTPTEHQGCNGCCWYTWTERDNTILGVKASDWYDFSPLTQEQRATSWWTQE